MLPRNFKRERVSARHPPYGSVHSGDFAGIEVRVGDLLSSVLEGFSLGAIVELYRVRGRFRYVRLMGDEDLLALIDGLDDLDGC